MFSILRTHRLLSFLSLILGFSLIFQPCFAKDAAYKPENAKYLVYVFNMYQPLPGANERVIEVRLYSQGPQGYQKFLDGLSSTYIKGLPQSTDENHRAGGDLRVELDLMQSDQVKTYETDIFEVKINKDGELLGLSGESLKSGRTRLGQWEVETPPLRPKTARIDKRNREGRAFMTIIGNSPTYSNQQARELADRRNQAGELIVDYPMTESASRNKILWVQIIENEKGFYDRYVAASNQPVWVEPYRALSARIVAMVNGVKTEFTTPDVTILFQDNKVIGFSGNTLTVQDRRGRKQTQRFNWGLNVAIKERGPKAYISATGFSPLLEGVADGYSEVVKQRKAQAGRCAPIISQR